jgi:formylglycine-generating enzyme
MSVYVRTLLGVLLITLITATALGRRAHGAIEDAAGVASSTKRYARIPGAPLRSILPSATLDASVQVAPFSLRLTPVTNREFLTFVRTHPRWQRGRVGNAADHRYLQHWAGAIDLGPNAGANEPVINVSWFAARAFCESQGARLPTWYEWELVAAADEHVPDARRNPAWRQKILAWYSRPSTHRLSRVGLDAPNFYGVHDMHWDTASAAGSRRK